MGTRADFYVGRGLDAEWIGSMGWDGYPDGHVVCLIGLTDEQGYRTAVQTLLDTLDHATRPAQGWPWPWADSQTTDYAYAFEAGVVYVACFGSSWQVLRQDLDDFPDGEEKAVFPDMTAQQRITFGRRSGVLVVTRTGIVDMDAEEERR